MKNELDLPLGHLFRRQPQHFLLLALLLPGAAHLAQPALGDGSWLGVSDLTWFYAVLLVAVVHQVVVWFAWRTQLVFSLFSRLFGRHDMTVWACIFLPLLALRPVLTIGLGMADSGSLGPLRGIHIALALLLLIPAAYTGWSVVRYFGVPRALGADHFRRRFRDMPFVREGIFRYSSDAMYAFGFLVLWSIALLTSSKAALVAALFQHAYIWVHLYCTEEPDMQVIYGRRVPPAAG